MLKYFLLWFPMLLIAIVNGAVREYWIKKHTKELTAHQLSTLLLFALFSFYIGFVINRFPPRSPSNALIVGLFWLVLTLGFEFGFGRWRGSSWATLLADYNLARGRLWVFIPIWVTIAPLLFYRLYK